MARLVKSLYGVFCKNLPTTLTNCNNLIFSSTHMCFIFFFLYLYYTTLWILFIYICKSLIANKKMRLFVELRKNKGNPFNLKLFCFNDLLLSIVKDKTNFYRKCTDTSCINLINNHSFTCDNIKAATFLCNLFKLKCFAYCINKFVCVSHKI